MKYYSKWKNTVKLSSDKKTEEENRWLNKQIIGKAITKKPMINKSMKKSALTNWLLEKIVLGFFIDKDGG